MTVVGEIYGGRETTNTQVINSTVLANAAGLVVGYAPQDRMISTFELHVPFSLDGALSGYKFFMSGAAGATIYTAYFKVLDGVTGLVVQEGIQDGASANIAGALADVGTHYLYIRGSIQGGTGTLQFKFAQNVADPANGINVLAGSWIRTHYL